MIAQQALTRAQLAGMRMEDSPGSVEVVQDGVVATPAPMPMVSKGDPTVAAGSSVAPASSPPLPEEKLQGKELLEALKKQVCLCRGNELL